MDINEIIKAISPGGVLLVHASFKACKAAGYSPDDVIQALLNTVGPEGTLVMPTFSYCYLHHPLGAVYDPAQTPGVDNGILSETFRKMPGTIRSSNPTYSVAVRGKYSEFLTSGSRDDAGVGHGSSYEKAMKLDAEILLLNVGNNRNSMLHYAEIASGVPYNDIPFRESWGRNATTVNGEMKLLPEYPACSEAFGKFDEVFVAENFARKLDGSYLIQAKPMVDFICREIHRQADIMLCDNRDCEPCSLRRKRLRDQGLI